MRGVVATLLAGLAWLALRGWSGRLRHPSPPQQQIEQAGAAEHARQPPAAKQPSGAAAPNGPVRRGDPRDEEHKRQERAHWRIANLTGIATAGAAVVAAIFAAGAYFAASEQAVVARDALVVSDRPWVKVEKISVRKLTIIDGAIIGFAEVAVKNFGHSPAINLFVKKELKPFNDSKWGRDITAAICKTAREKREAPTIQVVFPDEGKPNASDPSDEGLVPMQLYIPAEDISLAKTAYLESNFARDKISLGVEQAIQRRNEDEKTAFQAKFTLSGCVTYFSYHGLVGQTGFVVNIYRRDQVFGGFTYDFGTFDTGKTGDIPVEEINVVNETLGGIDIR